jgi:hypothetical protein
MLPALDELVLPEAPEAEVDAEEGVVVSAGGWTVQTPSRVEPTTQRLGGWRLWSSSRDRSRLPGRQDYEVGHIDISPLHPHRPCMGSCATCKENLDESVSAAGRCFRAVERG